MKFIDKFRRITRDGHWVPEIDGLRFLAIFSVMMFHMSGELQERSGRHIGVEPRYFEINNWIHNGDRGVPLFFVISGLVLALPFARHFLLKAKAVSLRKYFLRRLTRLEPPYVVSILLFVGLFGLYSHFAGLTPEYMHHVYASTFYLHNLIYGQMTIVNSVSWSLEIEIQFYLLAPLFMQVFRIPSKLTRRSLLVTSMLLAMGLQHAFHPNGHVSMSILYFLQYFLAGLLLADVFVLDLEHLRTGWWWDAIGIAALALLYRADQSVLTVNLLLPFAILAICLAAMRSVAVRRFFSNHWIAVIGGMCYSLYLTHFMMIAVLFKITRRAIVPHFDYMQNLLIQLVVTGVPVVLFGVVFYLLIERPCMDPDWPSHLWQRLTGKRHNALEALDSAGIAE